MTLVTLCNDCMQCESPVSFLAAVSIEGSESNKFSPLFIVVEQNGHFSNYATSVHFMVYSKYSCIAKCVIHI